MHFVNNICYVLLLVRVVSANLDMGHGHQQHQNHSSAYCFSEEKKITLITVTKMRTTYEKKYNIMGLKFGKQMPIEKVVSETVPITTMKRVPHCCPGYKKNEINRMCVPHCEQPCPKHAACTQPNHCKCHDGYKEIRDTQQLLHCEDVVAAQEIETTKLTSTVKATTLKVVVFESNTEISTNSESEKFENTEAVEETTWDTTSTLSSDFERKFSFDCEFNGCPDNAECQNNSLCACMPGFEWGEVTTASTNDLEVMQNYTICLHSSETIYASEPIIEDSQSFILIVAVIVLGVVVLIILAAVLTRFIYLLHRKDKLRINEEINKENKLHCKYVTSDEESVAVVY